LEYPTENKPETFIKPIKFIEPELVDELNVDSKIIYNSNNADAVLFIIVIKYLVQKKKEQILLELDRLYPEQLNYMKKIFKNRNVDKIIPYINDSIRNDRNYNILKDPKLKLFIRNYPPLMQYIDDTYPEIINELSIRASDKFNNPNIF
jgi:hypothetical protein